VGVDPALQPRHGGQREVRHRPGKRGIDPQQQRGHIGLQAWQVVAELAFDPCREGQEGVDLHAQGMQPAQARRHHGRPGPGKGIEHGVAQLERVTVDILVDELRGVRFG
jgi:hypothetical protein